jgi:large subunit ribosomal protein L23
VNLYQIIKKPVVTEKSTAQQARNEYCFAVDPRATKQDVRRAVATIFKVRVEGVHTITMPAKFKRVGRNIGRTSAWKKAIVTLREGERIEFLEGA